MKLYETGRHNNEPPASAPPAATPPAASGETTTQVFSVSVDSQWSTYKSRNEKTCLRVGNFTYYNKKERDGLIKWQCSHKLCKAVMESDIHLQHRRIVNHHGLTSFSRRRNSDMG